MTPSECRSRTRSCRRPTNLSRGRRRARLQRHRRRRPLLQVAAEVVALIGAERDEALVGGAERADRSRGPRTRALADAEADVAGEPGAAIGVARAGALPAAVAGL